jgi:inosose dehydratase
MTTDDGALILKIGNAPLSWGVFEGDAEDNPPWDEVLDEIAAAGYLRTELGPIGFLPEDPNILRREFDSRGLTLTGGFVYEHMHDPANREQVLANARRVGGILAALGASQLVVIDRMVPERQRTAGRSEAAERLAPAAWETMLETIAGVARVASEEFGLRPVLHPHCGTHIEFADEIERLVEDLPDALIGLCIDTGHSAVTGMQAADLVDRYGDRVEYLHLKDVDGAAQQVMLDEDLEFEEALGVGLFCPLGQGIVDFAALHASLGRIDFSGIATVEQDPDPRVPNHRGLDSARESLEFLRRVGLAS